MCNKRCRQSKLKRCKCSCEGANHGTEINLVLPGIDGVEPEELQAIPTKKRPGPRAHGLAAQGGLR